MLWVYALTAGNVRLPPVLGARRERLRVVRTGRVAAIVGAHRRPPRAWADELRRFDGVVRRLACSLPAILPVRFGSCFDTAEELAFVLSSRQTMLRRALAHVRGRVQMTVRIVPGRRPGVETSTRAARTGHVRAVSKKVPPPSGTAYLKTRALEAARARQVAGFEPVRAAVQRWVRDERVEHCAAVTTVFHLVPGRSADAYRRALGRALASAGLKAAVSGPWPPYAFAE